MFRTSPNPKWNPYRTTQGRCVVSSHPLRPRIIRGDASYSLRPRSSAYHLYGTFSFGCTICGTYTGLRCTLLDHTSRTLWLSTDISPRTAWYLCTLQTIGRYTCWYTHLTVHTHWYSTTYMYLILYHTVPTIMSPNHTAYLVWYT